MRAFILKPYRCIKTQTKKWTHHFTYESCYRKVTSHNWEYIKREAKSEIEKHHDSHKVCDLFKYPCKVIFQQRHNGHPIHVTFDECVIDNEGGVCEINEWIPTKWV